MSCFVKKYFRSGCKVPTITRPAQSPKQGIFKVSAQISPPLHRYQDMVSSGPKRKGGATPPYPRESRTTDDFWKSGKKIRRIDAKFSPPRKQPPEIGNFAPRKCFSLTDLATCTIPRNRKTSPPPKKTGQAVQGFSHYGI